LSARGAAPGAGEAGFKVDIDQQRRVRLESLAGDAVEFENGTGIEAATAALIDQCGIRKAVAQNNPSGLKRGADNLIHILRAAGEIKKELSARFEVEILRIEENLANLLPDASTARLDGFHNFPALIAQPCREHMELRGLAAAVDALECNEAPAPHGETPILANGSLQ